MLTVWSLSKEQSSKFCLFILGGGGGGAYRETQRHERHLVTRSVTQAQMKRNYLGALCTMCLRFCYVARDAAAILRRSWISLYAVNSLFESTAISRRKFWASSKQAPRGGDHVNSDTLLLRPRRFYCAVGFLATILGVFSKISERTETAARWNGHLNKRTMMVLYRSPEHICNWYGLSRTGY